MCLSEETTVSQRPAVLCKENCEPYSVGKLKKVQTINCVVSDASGIKFV